MIIKTSIVLVATLLLTSVQVLALDKDEREVKVAVEKLLNGSNVDSVAKTALPGLFEVIFDNNTIYYMPGTGQFIAGTMFSKEGDNLSKKSLEQLAVAKVRQVHVLIWRKDKAIKIGNGPIEVIEVSDPDCPYCRKMEEYWKMRQKDVTRYVFLMPITELHPDSEKKARYILASPDQVKAFQYVLGGNLDGDEEMLKRTFNDNGRLKILEEITREAGVQSTPTYLIDGTVVNGADPDRIDDLINQEKGTDRDSTI